MALTNRVMRHCPANSLDIANQRVDQVGDLYDLVDLDVYALYDLMVAPRRGFEAKRDNAHRLFENKTGALLADILSAPLISFYERRTHDEFGCALTDERRDLLVDAAKSLANIEVVVEFGENDISLVIVDNFFDTEDLRACALTLFHNGVRVLNFQDTSLGVNPYQLLALLHARDMREKALQGDLSTLRSTVARAAESPIQEVA